jgi:hypothetical protein
LIASTEAAAQAGRIELDVAATLGARIHPASRLEAGCLVKKRKKAGQRYELRAN